MGGRGALRFARADNAPPPSFARLCSTLCRMLSARLSAWRPCVRMASFWTSSASRRTRKSAARSSRSLRIIGPGRTGLVDDMLHVPHGAVTAARATAHAVHAGGLGAARTQQHATASSRDHTKQRKKVNFNSNFARKSIGVPVLCGKGVSRLPVDVLAVNCAAAGAFCLWSGGIKCSAASPQAAGASGRPRCRHLHCRVARTQRLS